MARRRRGVARILRRRRQVRGRPASWRGHRAGWIGSAGAGFRRDLVRGQCPDARPDGDDRDERRLQGVTDAPGSLARPEGCRRRRGRPGRGPGPDRRAGASDAVRPSRSPGRRQRGLRGPARAASAAERPPSSSGSRGAARHHSGTASRSSASPRGSGAEPSACARSRARAGSGSQPRAATCSRATGARCERRPRVWPARGERRRGPRLGREISCCEADSNTPFRAGRCRCRVPSPFTGSVHGASGCAREDDGARRRPTDGTRIRRRRGHRRTARSLRSSTAAPAESRGAVSGAWGRSRSLGGRRARCPRAEPSTSGGPARPAAHRHGPHRDDPRRNARRRETGCAKAAPYHWRP